MSSLQTPPVPPLPPPSAAPSEPSSSSFSVSATHLDSEGSSRARLDLSEPRYDQSTFLGRARHFFSVTDPRLCFCSDATLDNAKLLVDQYRAGIEPAGTTDEDVWRAKKIYDSAFHPETGEKQVVIGRMAFQTPGNMAITGSMLTWYKSTSAVVFWQWVNQSFNAVVNYTNRNASAGLTNEQLAGAYVAATGGALAVSLGLNAWVSRSPTLSKSIVGRFVPFAAVAAANCINIPLMRQRELVEGIDVLNEDDVVLGKSVPAAQTAIAQVTVSRVLMGIPDMIIPPIIMERFEQTPFMKRFPWMNAPIQIAMCGVIIVFVTPLCCAIFPQEAKIPVVRLEPTLRDRILYSYPDLKEVHYNKGL